MGQLKLVGMPEPTTDSEVSFNDFWSLYPRHEAKKDALKAWGQLDSEQQLQACIALMGWRKVFMAREATSFIPYPATWLRGERWEDELPAEYKPYKKPVQDAISPLPERTKMPDMLREMLAKMRK